MKNMLFALSFAFFLAAPVIVQAQEDTPSNLDCTETCSDACIQAQDPNCYTPPSNSLPATITPTTPTTAEDVSAPVVLLNPLGTTDPREIIGNLIKAIISIIGSVTLLMFVYGGVLWITSMGDDKKVLKGKQIIVWCVIGLAVIAGAYALTNAVISGLTTGSVIPTG